MPRARVLRVVSFALVTTAAAAACGDAFESAPGGATGAGGATTTTGAGGSGGATTGAGGAATGGGGTTTTGAGGTATGGGGGTTTTGAGGAGGGGGTTTTTTGAGGHGGAGGGPACSCDPGEVCDPGGKKCVQAASVRVVSPSGGAVCAYAKGGQLVLEQALVGKPAGTPYVLVPAGDTTFASVPPNASCPPQKPAQGAAITASLAGQKHHTLIEAEGGFAFVADEAPQNSGGQRVRYFDALPKLSGSMFDVSPILGQNLSPKRFISTGGMSIAVNPVNDAGYHELPPGYEISGSTPPLLTAPDAHYQLPPGPVGDPGSTITVYAFAAPLGAMTLACEDGFAKAKCVPLTPAFGTKDPDCFKQQGSAAPTACVQCGARVSTAIFSCQGGPTNNDWQALVADPACACAPSVPTWYRCVGGQADCATYCESVGRKCSDSCGVNNECAGDAGNAGPFGYYSVESNGMNNYCYGTGTCGKALVGHCVGAWNNYCCCGS